MLEIKFIFIVITFAVYGFLQVKADIIIDSQMTFEQAIEGTNAPKGVIQNLVLINVKYYSFDKKLHQGQLVVHKELQNDISEIFEIILQMKFPVDKVIPIVRYGWSDDSSMADNNTSAFCYRFVASTTRLSNHALGRAIDINPFNNPAVYANGKISPDSAKYNPQKAGSLHGEHPIVKEFLKKGWRWGGDFNSFKDYQHFDKQ